jgi:hypothetical protein
MDKGSRRKHRLVSKIQEGKKVRFSSAVQFSVSLSRPLGSCTQRLSFGGVGSCAEGSGFDFMPPHHLEREWCPPYEWQRNSILR